MSHNPRLQITCHTDCDDAYARAVADAVFQTYDGQRARWRISDKAPLRAISLGGRAGVVSVNVEGRACCGKLYYDGRWSTQLRLALGMSKAKRAYQHALRLASLKIACPGAIAYVEKRPWGPGLLLCELLEKGKRLDQWLAHEGVSAKLIDALAATLRHMHDQGVTHNDLSPRNLFVRPTDSGFEILLLDYEDCRFFATVETGQRLADLHHLDERLLLAVSLRDRLRCLRTYAGDHYQAWRNELSQMLERSQSKYLQAYRATEKTDD